MWSDGSSELTRDQCLNRCSAVQNMVALGSESNLTSDQSWTMLLQCCLTVTVWFMKWCGRELCTGWAIFVYLTILPNINRFSNFFHCRNQQTICNKTITTDPTTSQVCHYTTLWNVSVLRVTIKNRTISATIYFKKLATETTCLLSQLLSKKSCLTVLRQMFNVSALLLDDTSKTVSPLTNGAINQMLLQFVPLSDDRLLQLVSCRESSTLIGHLLKNIPNSIID